MATCMLLLVTDLTGRVIRTIAIPSIFDISVHGNKMVGICETTIYGYSLYGEIMWRFENEKYELLFA